LTAGVTGFQEADFYSYLCWWDEFVSVVFFTSGADHELWNPIYILVGFAVKAQNRSDPYRSLPII
jgi:hypothetical protein